MIKYCIECSLRYNSTEDGNWNSICYCRKCSKLLEVYIDPNEIEIEYCN